MDKIMWLIDNWELLTHGFAYMVTGCSIVAKVTPWKWDDNLFAKIIHTLSINPKEKC